MNLQIERGNMVSMLLEAYNLGAHCAKEISSGRKWTMTKTKQERSAIDSILKEAGASTLTDEEYEKFCS